MRQLSETSLKPGGESSGRTLPLLVVVVVALSTMSLATYLQLRDATLSLSECREVLSNAKSDIEVLMRYSQNLYANYTSLYEYAKALSTNCTVLQEAYYEISRRYELVQEMVWTYQKLYEELYSSYSGLKANYSSLIEQLKEFDEVLELIKELRLFYLASRVLSFNYINESLAIVLSNSSYPVKPVKTWDRTLLFWTSPLYVSVPTPEPGYLVVSYNNTRGACFTIKAYNSYIVPGRYATENTYFNVRTCSTRGREAIPVLPYHTTLEFTLETWVISTPGERPTTLVEVSVRFQYVVLRSEPLKTREE